MPRRLSRPTRATEILDDEACRAFQSVMEIVGKRWTGAIMLAISRGSQRFGEILRVVDGLSDRLLSQRLKELAAHGLVLRTIVPTTPAYSEYTLTPLGEELIQAMQPLVMWGYLHPLPEAGPATGPSHASRRRPRVTGSSATPDR
ncbi:winged helix-turn-helix transcriptional regulator [Cellulosimicrobium cellulans]|uniref:winged helix-turn-helix transcriptional regulator n=1 Tax=Cellulosimicrobium cellulans TaxID=1710 RepID=UPI0027DD46C5|nr:helix-turn-helix domain-containing protein [Cellulosimicrobium cellulans]